MLHIFPPANVCAWMRVVWPLYLAIRYAYCALLRAGFWSICSYLAEYLWASRYFKLFQDLTIFLLLFINSSEDKYHITCSSALNESAVFDFNSRSNTAELYNHQNPDDNICYNAHYVDCPMMFTDIYNWIRRHHYKEMNQHRSTSAILSIPKWAKSTSIYITILAASLLVLFLFNLISSFFTSYFNISCRLIFPCIGGCDVSLWFSGLLLPSLKYFYTNICVSYIDVKHPVV